LSIVGVKHPPHPLRESCCEELEARSKEGWDQVNKAIGIGAFIISVDAVNHLNNLKKESSELETKWNRISFWEYLDSEASIYIKYVDIIRECAKRDLHVK
jgi:hypothetical protein